MKITRVEFDADGSKGPPVFKACDLCCLRPSRCGYTLYCDDKYYTVTEEPKELQSEWEWRKERYRLLCDTTIPLSDEQIKEFKDLPIWLRDNQPEQWVVCTKENTKVGDEVKCNNGDMRKIMYIQKKPAEESDCVVSYLCDQEEYTSTLSGFEINIYGKDKE